MNELDQIALAQSLPRLATVPGVVIVNDWKEQKPGIWLLTLQLELQGAAPTEYVPKCTEWELLVDFNQDTWGKVQVHPALSQQSIDATFEHQQFNGGHYKNLPCRGGYICTEDGLDRLASSRNAQVSQPTSTIDRLVWHVSRAQQWLALAATGNLAKPGDHFELPDFNTLPEIPQHFLTAYLENNDSYGVWQGQPRIGVAEISNIKGAFVIQRFLSSTGKVIYKPDWGLAVSQTNVGYKVLWLRLDIVPVVNNWQAPKTFADLATICQQQGIDIVKELQPLWKQLGNAAGGFLLVGMPIPAKIGEAPYRYHWQALEVISPKAKTFGGKASVLESLAQTKFRSSSLIHWQSKAENWDPMELQNRGRLPKSVADATIVLFGVGALGSLLAEQLVRMGVKRLTIVDKDTLEAGNLVRHSLNLSHLNDKKAPALAQQLNLVNPSAQVTGLEVTLPSKDATFSEALQAATLIIDCTAEDVVLKSFPMDGLSPNVPIISCSLGLNASRLFFYSNLASDFSWSEFDQWFQPYRTEENELARQIDLPRGAGCWHPLTPAPLNRIAGLAGMAIEFIEQVCSGEAALPVLHCETWPELKLTRKADVLTPVLN